MSIFQRVKNFIGRNMVDGIINLKPFKIPSFNQVQTIGILYNASDEQIEKQVQQIANEFKNEGKKVYLLGYIQNKNPYKQKHIHLYNEYFWKEHLNFFNVPLFSKIGEFVTNQFDLLINLYSEDQLPLQAVSAKSNAHFKIGLKSDLSIKYNHVLIDCGENTSVNYAVELIKHYLNTINHE